MNGEPKDSFWTSSLVWLADWEDCPTELETSFGRKNLKNLPKFIENSSNPEAEDLIVVDQRLGFDEFR